MKIAAFLASIILISVVCSCEKLSNPEINDLRQAFDSSFDVQQNNKFNEANLLNNWVGVKYTYEIYQDGNLVETRDIGQEWDIIGSFTLAKDHTLKYGYATGVWLYYKNFLLIKRAEYYYHMYEVIEVTSDSLKIREESMPYGIAGFTPFFIDNSGRHAFYVLKYTAQ